MKYQVISEHMDARALRTYISGDPVTFASAATDKHGKYKIVHTITPALYSTQLELNIALMSLAFDLNRANGYEREET